MEFLRALLYSDRRLASATTGQFHVTARGGRLHLRIQLQADCRTSAESDDPGAIVVTVQPAFPAVVRAVPYFDFRDALSVDYERKFQHE